MFIIHIPIWIIIKNYTLNLINLIKLIYWMVSKSNNEPLIRLINFYLILYYIKLVYVVKFILKLMFLSLINLGFLYIKITCEKDTI